MPYIAAPCTVPSDDFAFSFVVAVSHPSLRCPSESVEFLVFPTAVHFFGVRIIRQGKL
jgi:hypothetical protein